MVSVLHTRITNYFPETGGYDSKSNQCCPSKTSKKDVDDCEREVNSFYLIAKFVKHLVSVIGVNLSARTCKIFSLFCHYYFRFGYIFRFFFFFEC